MILRLFSFLLLCCFTSIYADPSIVPYLTSENDTLSLIDETVNVFNGKLVQIDKDIEIQGSHPLELVRYYDGGHHFDSDIGYGYGLSLPILLVFYSDRATQNLTIEQREGFEVVCTVTKIKSHNKKDKISRYKGTVDPKFFQYGYTNCCESLLRGESSLLALKVEGDHAEFIVTLGDGTKRFYHKFPAVYNLHQHIYRLIREDFSDGSHRHYSYNDSETLALKRVWTTNPDNTLTLNWLNYTYSKNLVQINASNGQSVCYHWKNKKGKAKKAKLGSYSSIEFSKRILEKVTGTHLTPCEYESLSRSHFTNTLFSTKKVSRPNGRFIKVDYDDDERIKNLWTSGLDIPLYQFHYHRDHHAVTDARGGIQRFFYKQRRLIKHEEPHCTHHFEWDHQGQLKKQTLTDDHHIPVVEREYDYDAKGNVKEATVTASIKESGSKDKYTIRYHYSDDGRNLLTCEEHGDGNNITYEYQPNTNLLAKKLIWTSEGIVEREFYLYDANGIRICTLKDDGSQPLPTDPTNITYCKFTEVTPQLDEKIPGMTLPKIIQEGYLDAFGNRHLLKRTERTYSHGDLLAEEKIFDAQGKYCYSLKYDYNDRRELISEFDPLGYQTNYNYDDNGNKIAESKLGGNRLFVYDYDFANNLIKETENLHDGKILTTTHDYDSLGNRILTKDHFEKITTFKHDLVSREILVTDPLGYTLQKTHDVHGNVILQIDQDGHSTTTLYNLYGNPLEIHYPDGTEKRFGYNLRGHLVYEKERDGQSTTYEVDYRGRITLAKTFAPDGTHLKTIQKFYKGEHLIREIDANGNQIAYSYDFNGRLICQEQGEKRTFFEYDSLGRLAKTITPERIDVKEYDFLDHISEERVEDQSGTVFQKNCYAYDINGNCISQKTYHTPELFAETKTVYDPRNQPILMIDAYENQTIINYYYSDHLQKETIDPLGRKTIEIYDPLQRLKDIVKFSANGSSLAHCHLNYDGRGNKTLQTENILCNGQSLGLYTIVTAYDPMGQKLSETEENTKTTLYKYHLGRLQQITYPNGIILSHAYDGCGRLSRLTSSDDTIDYQYSYDANDNLLLVEDFVNKTKVIRDYDAFNRQFYEKQATGFELVYSYDILDRLKEVRFNDHKITYDYSPTSLRSAKRYQNDKLLYQYDQTTDLCGKVKTCQLPNKSSVTYTWDLMGRCSTINSHFYQQKIDYDSVGNLISLSGQDPQGSYTTIYTYDDNHQLSSETGPFSNLYLYDSIHNRRCKNAFANTINHLNQVAQDETNQFTYDPNGRRFTKDKATYTYDALGRLTKFTTDQQSIHYLYDPFGRLIERSGKSTTQFLHQFDTEIASFEDGRMTAFKPLNGMHAPFAVELDGIAYSPIRNHRGDLCVLLEDAPICSYRYNAFGEFIHQGEVYSPWLFSSQRYDHDTDLYHYSKRQYDPTLGVWLTPDPLGFIDGPNLYAYVNNNPLTYVDPYGLWKEEYNKTRQFIRAADRIYADVRDKCRNIKEQYQNFKEASEGFTRGLIDDASFGLSEQVLGEYKFKSSIGRNSYYMGTGVSLVFGFASGATEIKCANALLKASTKSAKGAFNVTKAVADIKTASRVTEKAKIVLKGSSHRALKSGAAKETASGVIKKGSRNRLVPDVNAQGAHTVYRKDPLTGKISHYETFQPQTNCRNPNPWESIKRFDNSGKIDQSHFNKVLKKEIHEPHIHDPTFPGGIRPAQYWEIP